MAIPTVTTAESNHPMKHQFLIIALISSSFLVGCDSEKTVKKEPPASAEKATKPRQETEKKAPETLEEITANTKRAMDKMNNQASSEHYEAANDPNAAALLATQKVIEEAARNTTEETRKAMQEAAKSALEASEKMPSTPAK
jgi:ABC-type transporter MlaC component